jgi:hypothetical protein
MPRKDLPPSIQAILDEGLDVITRLRRLKDEAAKLGMNLIFETNLHSPEYGNLISIAEMNTGPSWSEKDPNAP